MSFSGRRLPDVELPPNPKSVVSRVSTDNCLVPSQTAYTKYLHPLPVSTHTKPVAMDIREVRACRSVGSNLLLWGEPLLNAFICHYERLAARRFYPNYKQYRKS